MPDNLIIGGGIAGISAGYHLRKQGVSSVIYEKDNDWGGLCASFTLDGFRFDRFVHFTFADNPETAKIFSDSVPLYEHPPVASNYYNGIWLKHPAQNNLAPLPEAEKEKIIDDFIARPRKAVEDISHYGEWLEVQYGYYFAHNFPYKYTRKYWGVEPEDLETKWVGVRMNCPSLEQVLAGAEKEQDENFYYTKVMKYPKKGGFRSILNKARQGLDIRFNKQVVRIDERAVHFADGTNEPYGRLISTLPLPDIIGMLPDVPDDIVKAANALRYTCGYQVSLGFNRPEIPKYLWFYIYDEEIPPARVYSPSLKSPDNVPEGCSSLQAEIFFANGAHIPKKEEILEKTIEKLLAMNLFNREDIVVQDIRFEPYANILFDKDIYKNRQRVIDFLTNRNIESIGRFGKWDYLWSHQAFESGAVVFPASNCLN